MSFDRTWQVMSSDSFPETETEVLWLTNSTTMIFIAVGGDGGPAVAREQLVTYFGQNPSLRNMTIVAEEETGNQASTVIRCEVATVDGWGGAHLYVMSKLMGEEQFTVGFTGIVPDKFAEADHPRMLEVYNSIQAVEPAAIQCLANGASPCHDVYFPCCEGSCIAVDIGKGIIDGLVVLQCWDGNGPNPADCRGYGDTCSPSEPCCSGICVPDVTGWGSSTCSA